MLLSLQKPYFVTSEKPPAGDGSLADSERAAIVAALAAARGNRSVAADRLGIHRNTLRRKIRELDITVPGEE